jgi:hypothetical protein
MGRGATHNQKVPGSNPGPATKKPKGNREVAVPLLFLPDTVRLHSYRYSCRQGDISLYRRRLREGRRVAEEKVDAIAT